MLPTEILLLVGVALILCGKLLSAGGRMGLQYVREEAARLEVERIERSGRIQYKRIVINSHLDRLEKDHGQLKIAFGQCQTANAQHLSRIAALENLLIQNGIEIPVDLPKAGTPCGSD